MRLVDTRRCVLMCVCYKDMHMSAVVAAVQACAPLTLCTFSSSYTAYLTAYLSTRVQM